MSKDDTVLLLVGRIGTANLSSYAKKQIAKLNELNKNLTHLETALDEAEEDAKKAYEKQVNKAKETLSVFEKELLILLKEEEADLQKRKDKIAAKQEEERKKQEQIAAAKKIDEDNAAKAAADEEAKKKLAEDEAAKLAADEEAKKAADEAAKAAAEAAKNQNPEEAKKGSGMTGILVTGVLVVFTAGLYFWNKNKQ